MAKTHSVKTCEWIDDDRLFLIDDRIVKDSNLLSRQIENELKILCSSEGMTYIRDFQAKKLFNQLLDQELDNLLAAFIEFLPTDQPSTRQISDEIQTEIIKRGLVIIAGWQTSVYRRLKGILEARNGGCVSERSLKADRELLEHKAIGARVKIERDAKRMLTKRRLERPLQTVDSIEDLWRTPDAPPQLIALAEALKALGYRARCKVIQDYMTKKENGVKTRHPSSILTDARKNGHGPYIDAWFTKKSGIIELHKEPKSKQIIARKKLVKNA